MSDLLRTFVHQSKQAAVEVTAAGDERLISATTQEHLERELTDAEGSKATEVLPITLEQDAGDQTNKIVTTDDVEKQEDVVVVVMEEAKENPKETARRLKREAKEDAARVKAQAKADREAEKAAKKVSLYRFLVQYLFNSDMHVARVFFCFLFPPIFCYFSFSAVWAEAGKAHSVWFLFLKVDSFFSFFFFLSLFSADSASRLCAVMREVLSFYFYFGFRFDIDIYIFF